MSARRRNVGPASKLKMEHATEDPDLVEKSDDIEFTSGADESKKCSKSKPLNSDQFPKAIEEEEASKVAYEDMSLPQLPFHESKTEQHDLQTNDVAIRSLL